MGRFKVICNECGSENIMERSQNINVEKIGKHIKCAQGIQRKCLECSNEGFMIFKTWLE